MNNGVLVLTDLQTCAIAGTRAVQEHYLMTYCKHLGILTTDSKIKQPFKPTSFYITLVLWSIAYLQQK